jgi:glycosyltransferase involved in cell wall biosynthesis
MTATLYLLEPSKVGVQHILMLDGYVRALGNSRPVNDRYTVEVCASRSTLQSLSREAVERVQVRRVFVMNPEKRRLLVKSLVEFAVTTRCLWRMRPGDLLVVTCVLPTSFILIEWVNRLLRRTGVHVVLHGDMEGLLTTSRLGPLSIFRWAQIWLRLRRTDSRIDLVVLDDFIKRRLIERDPDKFTEDRLAVIHHPVDPMARTVTLSDPPVIGFLGYRTAAKSFDDFARLAARLPSLRFVAIGGGRSEDLRDGTVRALVGKDAYVAEIARCSVACFPFVSGYACSLSASALDALAAGTRIVALDRPFFRALSEYLGRDFVRVANSVDLLPEALLEMVAGNSEAARQQRVETIRNSKYGLAAVQRSFEHLAKVG